MDYGLRRAEAYKQLGFDEEFRDVLMMVAAHVVLDEPIRDEDREFLRQYLQIKIDNPREDLEVCTGVDIL